MTLEFMESSRVTLSGRSTAKPLYPLANRDVLELRTARLKKNAAKSPTGAEPPHLPLPKHARSSDMASLGTAFARQLKIWFCGERATSI